VLRDLNLEISMGIWIVRFLLSMIPNVIPFIFSNFFLYFLFYFDLLLIIIRPDLEFYPIQDLNYKFIKSTHGLLS
jgi:hypothetical protein